MVAAGCRLNDPHYKRVPRGHDPEHPHDHHDHAHGRHYVEIRELLERAALEGVVRDRALAIFDATLTPDHPHRVTCQELLQGAREDH